MIGWGMRFRLTPHYSFFTSRFSRLKSAIHQLARHDGFHVVYHMVLFQQLVKVYLHLAELVMAAANFSFGSSVTMSMPYSCFTRSGDAHGSNTVMSALYSCKA